MHYSRKLFKLLLLLFPLISLAQQQVYQPLANDTTFPQSWIRDYFNNPINKSRILTSHKKTAIIYFRPEYRLTQNGKNPISGDFGLTSVRLDIRGPILLNKLDFRFRSRYFPTITADDRLGFNRINFSLDYLYVNWHITPKISLMAGKNLRLYGGFEWDMAPFIINQYNQYLLSVDNFFPLGIQASFQVAKGNSIVVGFYQPTNKTVENRQKARGYMLQNQQATRFPIGLGALWRGTLFDGKLHTIWGAFGEKNFLNEMNLTVILGQRYTNSRMTVFFDYTIANKPTDFTLLSTATLDKYLYKKGNFATNVLYQVASTRLDLSLNKRKNWVLVFTGQYELGTQLKAQYSGFDDNSVRNFRQILMGNLQLEYFPIKGQDLHFYIFAQRRYDIFNAAIHKAGHTNQTYNSAGAGVMYSLPLL